MLEAVSCAHRGWTAVDYRFDSRLGVALVTCGIGALEDQARTAAVLALWSIVGELEASDDDEALRRGIMRAHHAIARLTEGWQSSNGPAAMFAALRLRGSRVQLAHVGRCRISRVEQARLEAMTTEHDVAHEGNYEEQLRAEPKLSELAHCPTRVLGSGVAEPELSSTTVRPGDEFLLATPALFASIDEDLTRTIARPELSLFRRGQELSMRACQSERTAGLLVRVSDSIREHLCLGGSERPPASFVFAPGAPLPPPPKEPYRGPNERWFREIATPICLSGRETEWIARTLWERAVAVPKTNQARVLARCVRWSISQLESRFTRTAIDLSEVDRLLAEVEASVEDPGAVGPKAARALEAWERWCDHNVGLGERNHDAPAWDVRPPRPDGQSAAATCLGEAIAALRAAPWEESERLATLLMRLAEAEGLWEWDHAQTGNDDAHIARVAREAHAQRALRDLSGAG